MAKKKTGVKKNESRTKGSSARVSGREAGDAAEAEVSGVHVINRQDIENHFGASETKRSDVNVQPAPNRPKTEVHLHLDEQVWQQAQAAARLAGLELPEYVERALERFTSDSAK